MQADVERELLAQRDVIVRKLQILYKDRNRISHDIEVLNRERTRITKALSDPVGASGMGNKWGDTLAVPTPQLRQVIINWSNSFGVGSGRILASRSGISARMIRRIKNDPQYTKFTMYSLAERLLIAMGREEAISNGELDVVPNPYMDLSRLNYHYLEE